MTIALRVRGVRGVVLDIEGTTTPISFVYDVLFPYARANLRAFLDEEIPKAGIETEFALLRREHEEDLRAGEAPPELRDATMLARYVEWLMDRDRKATGLKMLQGRIWQRGYDDGTLRGEVFPDVPAAFARWRAADLKIAIYSSGSVLGQRLLFAHTAHGDLTPYIDRYFDTGVGPKRVANSYAEIAHAMKLAPRELLFVSDVPQELDAARTIGLDVVLCVRPGNAPVDQSGREVIHSFDELI